MRRLGVAFTQRLRASTYSESPIATRDTVDWVNSVCKAGQVDSGSVAARTAPSSVKATSLRVARLNRSAICASSRTPTLTVPSTSGLSRPMAIATVATCSTPCRSARNSTISRPPSAARTAVAVGPPAPDGTAASTVPVMSEITSRSAAT